MFFFYEVIESVSDDEVIIFFKIKTSRVLNYCFDGKVFLFCALVEFGDSVLRNIQGGDIESIFSEVNGMASVAAS